MLRFMLPIIFGLSLGGPLFAQFDVPYVETDAADDPDPLSKVACDPANPECNFNGQCAACQGGSCNVPRRGYSRSVMGGCAAAGACGAGGFFVARRRGVFRGRRRLFRGRLLGRCRGC